MKKIPQVLLAFALFFYNAILNVLPLPVFVKYWDEVATILLLIFFIIKTFFSKRNASLRIESALIYILILSVIIIGLLGNVAFNYNNNIIAIIKDIVQFIKFPIGLMMLMDLNLGDRIGKIFKTRAVENSLKVITCMMFVLGIVSIFKDIGLSSSGIRYGITPYQFFFGHSTYLVLSCVMLICCFECFYGRKKHDKYIILLLITIALAMRTKGLAFVAVYILLKYASKWLKKYKLLYWLAIIGAIYMASFQKLQLYESYSTSAREVLYVESIKLSKDNFPLGSGFASFGSHLSWKYNSEIYNLIKIPFYNVENGDSTAVLGDAGYSYYIGQFGIVGVLLIVIIGRKIYYISMNGCNQSSKMALSLIFIYILIALTSETTLINNGTELAILISAIASNKNLRGRESEAA